VKTLSPLAPILELVAAARRPERWPTSQKRVGQQPRPQQVKPKQSMQVKPKPRLTKKQIKRGQHPTLPFNLYDDAGDYYDEYSDEGSFGAGDNPLGLKDDMFEFMNGCGFNPMGGFSF